MPRLWRFEPGVLYRMPGAGGLRNTSGLRVLFFLLLCGFGYGLDGVAHQFAEEVYAFVEGGGDGEDGDFADASLEFLEVLFGGGFVHFVGDDVGWFLDELGIVEFEFGEELFVVIPRVASIGAG